MEGWHQIGDSAEISKETRWLRLGVCSETREVELEAKLVMGEEEKKMLSIDRA